MMCTHKERYRIELLLASGASYRSVAAKFGFRSPPTVARHWRQHVTKEAKASYLGGAIKLHELAERAQAESMGLLDYLSIMRGQLMRMFQASSETGDVHGVNHTSGRLMEVLNMIAKLTGEIRVLSSGATMITNNIAVLNSPDFARVQSAILAALGPYPDARAAVINQLRLLEIEPDRPQLMPPVIEAQTIEEVTDDAMAEHSSTSR
jgi:hypothetical protein